MTANTNAPNDGPDFPPIPGRMIDRNAWWEWVLLGLVVLELAALISICAYGTVEIIRHG